MGRRLLAAALPLLAFLGGTQAHADDEVVAEVLGQLSPAVEPCEDMYKFSCETYVKKAKASSDPYIGDFVKWEAFKRIHAVIRETKKAVLTGPLGPDAFPIDSQLQNFYKSCMDDEGSDSIAQMGEILKKVGGWPVLDGGKSSAGTPAWYTLVQEFSYYGLGTDYLFKHGIVFDHKTKSGAIQLDRPTLILSQAQAYLSDAIAIAKRFGASESQAKKDMKEVLQFESDLSQLFSTPPQKKTVTAASFTLGQAGQTLKQYLSTLFQKSGASLKITDDEKVIIGDSKYFEGLFDLLAKAGSRTVANYLVLRAVKSSIAAGSMGSAAGGVSSSVSKSDRCEKSAGFYWKNPQVAAMSAFARSLVTPETRKDVQQIVESVREAIKQSLTDAQWMDDATRGKALKKLSEMGLTVGGPDEIFDRGAMDAYFGGLTYSPHSYLENALKKERFNSGKKFESLREYPDRHHWSKYFPYVTYDFPYYVTGLNYYMIPAAVLKSPFYSPGSPDFVKYGGLGDKAAHSINYGMMEDFWKPGSPDAFKQRAQCVKDYFGKFYIAGADAYVNKEKTKERASAGVEGVKAAFRAYQTSVGAAAHKKVGGTGYTGEQMYWIYNAQTKCAAVKPGKEVIWKQSWEPPRDAMVNGEDANSAEFARVFKCPAGSKVNPDKKCAIW